MRIIIQPIGLPGFERPAIETSSKFQREGPMRRENNNEDHALVFCHVISVVDSYVFFQWHSPDLPNLWTGSTLSAQHH
jgi:hypothetical protein